jgi:putative DNA methylase
MENVAIISPKKLIEVALPLDAINAACAREKSIRHGHPSTLHLWWARRPLAAARAVIFSQLVNDPEDLWRCQNPGAEPNKQVRGHWTKARAKLFTLIEELVLWENTTNEEVLNRAREEIRKSWREICELNKEHPEADELFDPKAMPGLHDPFAGGGAIPLEAQRLGLDAYASDLNPVAVLINKAMIEIPPKFSGRPPVNPEWREQKSLINRDWTGAWGLAEDVRYYANVMRDKAIKRIGHLYPPIEITDAIVSERPDLEPYQGKHLTVIAWLWARTVKSPNPAFSHIDVPLASTFVLSSKSGKDAYVVPIVENGHYRFTVKIGKSSAETKMGTKSARGANFRCIMSQAPIEPDYIRSEAMAGRMGARLMAIVAEGSRGRVYLSPNVAHENTAFSVTVRDCDDSIKAPIAKDPRPMTCLLYGMTEFEQLFTHRQLHALTTFSDIIPAVRETILTDMGASGLDAEPDSLVAGGTGALAYSQAVSLYLSFAVDKCSDYWSQLCTWHSSRELLRNTFGRQALPIIWDFAEGNPFSNSTGNWTDTTAWIVKFLESCPAYGNGVAEQMAAQSQTLSKGQFVSSDPPYYDNVGYADLADFFYVWLRRTLRQVYPQLLATIAVPKSEELVVATYRHGNKQKAEEFFLQGMTQVMERLASQSHAAAPVTIYYAFKQSETLDKKTNSSGWETFLEAVCRSGLAVTGTWPMRTELSNRMRGTDSNALASSIVLVCRPRSSVSASISRRQFIRELNASLPLALDAMTRESEGLHSPVAPVDLSQAIIGPGMAVFSKYSAVLEADGSPMSVKTALQLINRFLADDDFDADTQFCLRWFEQHRWEAGQFGEADVLARAKGTSVEGVKQSGVISASSGKVQLVRPAEYPADWDPATDQRLPIWEALHQLIRIFRTDGESASGRVLSQIESKAEPVRQLAYRLYTLCERAGLADEARAYNELITSWSGIESAAAKEPAATQRTLFDE